MTIGCADLILRSIVQSAVADCTMRLEDEVGTHGPPSWFETVRALNIVNRGSVSGARLLTMRAEDSPCRSLISAMTIHLGELVHYSRSEISARGRTNA